MVVKTGVTVEGLPSSFTVTQGSKAASVVASVTASVALGWMTRFGMARAEASSRLAAATEARLRILACPGFGESGSRKECVLERGKLVTKIIADAINRV